MHIVRHLRIYKEFMRSSIIREMEYPINFFGTFLITFIQFMLQIVFFGIIYSQINSLNGWSKEEVIFFLGILMVWEAIYGGIFFTGLQTLPNRIRTGDLDWILSKPAHSLFFVSFRYFNLGLFANIIVGIVTIIYAWSSLAETFTWFKLASFVFWLAIGILIAFSFLTLVMTLSFYLVNVSGAFELYREINNFSKKPDIIYSGWVKNVLTFCFPFLVILSFPAHAVFDPLSLTYQIGGLLSALLFLALALFFWSYSVKKYHSASS